MWIIVGLMPLFLHRDERIPKVFDILWEFTQKLASAGGSYGAVIQRSVGLSPSMLALGGAFTANKQVGT